MSWGIFEVYEDKWEGPWRMLEIHIIPCNKNGRMYVGHSVSGFCKCCPTIDPTTEPGKPHIYHHHQMH